MQVSLFRALIRFSVIQTELEKKTQNISQFMTSPRTGAARDHALRNTATQWYVFSKAERYSAATTTN